MKRGRKRHTDLSAIFDLLPKKLKGLQLEDGYKIWARLNRRLTISHIAKDLGISVSGITSFTNEMKKAAAAKMTLETMFEKSRPFRAGKKIIK